MTAAIGQTLTQHAYMIAQHHINMIYHVESGMLLLHPDPMKSQTCSLRRATDTVKLHAHRPYKGLLCSNF